MEKFIGLASVFCLLSLTFAQAQKKQLIDGEATRETKALYSNLRRLSTKQTLFGHQHAPGSNWR